MNKKNKYFFLNQKPSKLMFFWISHRSLLKFHVCAAAAMSTHCQQKVLPISTLLNPPRRRGSHKTHWRLRPTAMNHLDSCCCHALELLATAGTFYVDNRRRRYQVIPGKKIWVKAMTRVRKGLEYGHFCDWGNICAEFIWQRMRCHAWTSVVESWRWQNTLPRLVKQKCTKIIK